MRSRLLDGGAYCRTAFQAIAKTATAGGAGDNTQVDGAWIDRLNADGMALSAKLVIVYEAQLGDAATLSFAVAARDADDLSGTGAAAYGDPVTTVVVATGNSGGQLVDGTVEVDLDLSSAREFVQTRITPDLSAGSTDTLKWSAELVLFGMHNDPSTAAIGTIGGPNS